MATKIALKQLSDEVLALINGGGGALLRDIISNVAVGAAASGTKFPLGQNLTEFAETILRKDITPTIQTSFSGAGVKEVGTIVNGTTMSLKISNLSAVTVPINKIEFFIGSTKLDSQSFVAGQSNYSFVYNQAIAADTTVKAVLTYNGNSTVQGTGTFTFAYKVFYGLTTLSAITDGNVNGLINSFGSSLQTTKGYTWNNITANDQKFCYLYPSSLGALTSIKDGNGFEQIQGYIRSQVQLTYPTNGQNVSYYVYLLQDATTGTGFKQVYA